MKRSIVLPIVILALMTLACAVGDVTQAVGLSKATETTAPTERPPLQEPTSAPQQIPTAAPTNTSEPRPPTEEPTEAPPEPTNTPTGPVYFREDFNNNINWSYEYITGNTQDQCVGPSVTEGQLRWACRSGEETQLKIYEGIQSYEDVVVQVQTENYASNTNWVVLMCRVNDQGWIEFRFTCGGLYEIYRFDRGLRNQGKNPYVYIANGVTAFTKPGKTNNTVAMVCSGDNFEYYANGNRIELVVPPQRREEYAIQGAGGVGIGFIVMGDNPGPVDVGIEWFETFEP